jgi:two-component system, OmpR family, response regulator
MGVLFGSGAPRETLILRMRMLVSGADTRPATSMRRILRAAGYAVDVVTTMGQLVAEAKSAKYALFIIDRSRSGEDAVAAVRTLRSERCLIPILMISADGKIEDRVGALDAGADDYITVPFDHMELLARIRALLRRPRTQASAVLRAGNLEIDDEAGEVRCFGKPLYLRAGELRLLTLLVRSNGRVVPKSKIEAELPEAHGCRSGNAIEARVSRLRKALKRVPADVAIETVRGHGYQLGHMPPEPHKEDRGTPMLGEP